MLLSTTFHKIKDTWKHVSTYFKTSFKEGYEWIGIDGLINMETSALVVMFLLLFFPALWSAILTLIIVAGKCFVDKNRGRENEKHDFICCIIGIGIGVIFGIA